jgi:hypothetical protein
VDITKLATPKELEEISKINTEKAKEYIGKP